MTKVLAIIAVVLFVLATFAIPPSWQFWLGVGLAVLAAAHAI